MIKKWAVILFILLGVSVSNGIEKAERISDREIIERLTRVETKLDVVNQRFDELRGFMIWGFGVTFAGIFSLMGFVLWDRRTALAPAVGKNKELEEREEVLERWKGKIDAALERLAGRDVEVAEVLRYVGLVK